MSINRAIPTPLMTEIPTLSTSLDAHLNPYPLGRKATTKPVRRSVARSNRGQTFFCNGSIVAHLGPPSLAWSLGTRLCLWARNWATSIKSLSLGLYTAARNHPARKPSAPEKELLSRIWAGLSLFVFARPPVPCHRGYRPF